MNQKVSVEELLGMARRCDELSGIDGIDSDLRIAALHTADSITTFLGTLSDQDKAVMESAIDNMSDLMNAVVAS